MKVQCSMFRVQGCALRVAFFRGIKVHQNNCNPSYVRLFYRPRPRKALSYEVLFSTFSGIEANTGKNTKTDIRTNTNSGTSTRDEDESDAELRPQSAKSVLHKAHLATRPSRPATPFF